MSSGDMARQRGFGYLMVLFALAALGLVLAGTGQVWHTAAQREKETELLFIGQQFRLALRSYYENTPQPPKQYPKSIDELLDDQRFGLPMRHLRRLYRDPITGQAQWGLVRAGGRIVGVHSLAEGRPFKTDFQGPDAAFAGAQRYDQWVFSPNGTGGEGP